MLWNKLSGILLANARNYNAKEVELIVNFFPHDTWAHQDFSAGLEAKFYEALAERVIGELENAEDARLLALFQGFSRPRRVPRALINRTLNEVLKRLQGG